MVVVVDVNHFALVELVPIAFLVDASCLKFHLFAFLPLVNVNLFALVELVVFALQVDVTLMELAIVAFLHIFLNLKLVSS